MRCRSRSPRRTKSFLKQAMSCRLANIGTTAKVNITTIIKNRSRIYQPSENSIRPRPKALKIASVRGISSQTVQTSSWTPSHFQRKFSFKTDSDYIEQYNKARYIFPAGGDDFRDDFPCRMREGPCRSVSCPGQPSPSCITSQSL